MKLNEIYYHKYQKLWEYIALLVHRSFQRLTWNVTAAAVIGGGIAKITGGDFTHGVITAAYGRLFNDMAHAGIVFHVSARGAISAGSTVAVEHGIGIIIDTSSGSKSFLDRFDFYTFQSEVVGGVSNASVNGGVNIGATFGLNEKGDLGGWST